MTRTMPTTYPQSGMLAHEIAQQPDLWQDTLQRVAQFLEKETLDYGPVVLTGAGTSAYAAQCVADAWPSAKAIATTDLLLLSREEIDTRIPGWQRGGLLISLARSGNSPESAGVVHRVKEMYPEVRHLAITCNSDGELNKISEIMVLTLDERTNDRSLAMTGSFSNLVVAGLALRHLATLQAAIPTIAARAKQHLESMFATASEIAAEGVSRFVVLASSMEALTREMTLKSLELTAGATVGMYESFLGFRHGPISILRENTPIICVLSTDKVKQQYESDAITEYAERGSLNVCLIGADDDTQLPHRWKVPALAPSLPDPLRAPFEVVFGQLLAYAHSIQAGVDPDNPSPDGQVTRVVRPFALHS